MNLVFAVAFGPDETTILTASEDGNIILWDIETGRVIRRYAVPRSATGEWRPNLANLRFGAGIGWAGAFGRPESGAVAAPFASMKEAVYFLNNSG